VVFHNRFATLLALPVERTERLARSRFAGWFAPIFRRVLARVSGAVQPVSLPEELKAGPFSGVVVALDGIIQASVLRHILDGVWASPHLTERTKALIFAVIARGLGSAGAEREARRLLGENGLVAAQVDEILAHLASPALDDTENAILRYVRETLWYRPAAVQRRGRALRAKLTNAQFVETVGIAALANMVCRLSLALDEA
jgi:alkylhydroperoxidase family enzyme